MYVAAEERNDYVCRFWSSVSERGRFPSSPSHVSKSTCDVREFLKNYDKGNHSIQSPNIHKQW